MHKDMHTRFKRLGNNIKLHCNHIMSSSLYISVIL